MLLSSFDSPLGTLNLISDEHVLLAANLSNLKALKESLSEEDSMREIKSVKKIPVITDLLQDYSSSGPPCISGYYLTFLHWNHE